MLAQMKDLAEKLADADVSDSPTVRAFPVMDDMVKHMDDLKEALRRNDKPAANKALTELKDDIRKQADIARQLAAECDDPIRKKEFNDIANGLDQLIPRLEDVVKRLLQNPYDKNALKDLEDIERDMHDLNARLGDAINAENSAKLSKALQDVRNAVLQGRDPDLRTVAELLKKQAIIAKARAAKTSDAQRRRDLLAAARDLKDAIKNIAEAARTKDVAKVNQVIETVLDHVANMAITSDDPFIAAAQEIDAARANRTGLSNADPNSAAGRLLAGSNKISELMQLLAAAAKAGIKKDIILISRQIAEQVNVITKASGELAATTTDPRLKEDLQSYAAPLKNYAVQLKILTAVKAGTSDDDKSAKQQLVACAKGIAAGVVLSCRSGESALLKQKK